MVQQTRSSGRLVRMWWLRSVRWQPYYTSHFKFLEEDASAQKRIINQKPFNSRLLLNGFFVTGRVFIRNFLSNNKTMIPASANYFLFILGLLAFNLNAQETRLLNGVVTFEGEVVPDVIIENLASRQRITTDEEGTFAINGRLGDSLSVAHPDHKYFILVLGESDFEKDLLNVDLKQMSIELDEVVVEDFSHINAYDLGIIDHPVDIPTRYERRLYTTPVLCTGTP